MRRRPEAAAAPDAAAEAAPDAAAQEAAAAAQAPPQQPPQLQPLAGSGAPQQPPQWQPGAHAGAPPHGYAHPAGFPPTGVRPVSITHRAQAHNIPAHAPRAAMRQPRRAMRLTLPPVSSAHAFALLFPQMPPGWRPPYMQHPQQQYAPPGAYGMLPPGMSAAPPMMMMGQMGMPPLPYGMPPYGYAGGFPGRPPPPFWGGGAGGMPHMPPPPPPPPPAPKPVSRDWMAHKDEAGDVYYHNTATGETSWDKPEGFTVS